MPPPDIGTNGIIKQLKNLNQNKATGPYELPARVLKETAEQIAPIITHPFSKVARHSYLGVKLDSKLSWEKHITEITTKSSKVLAMVKRTLGPANLKLKTHPTIC